MPVQGYSAADLARLRSIATRPRGWSHRIKPRVREYRDERTGHWIKIIRDEFQTIRMRWEGQDAHVTLPHLRLDPWVGVIEERV